MPQYGFSINIDGNSQAALQKINGALNGLGAKATMETKKVGSAFQAMHSKISGAFGGLKNLLLGGLGIGGGFAAFEFIKESVGVYEGSGSGGSNVG